MDGKNEKAVSIAKAYGQLSRSLAEMANAERIRIAQANFNASRAQIEAQRESNVAELASVFQKHVGTIQANAAYRGVGGGSIQAALTASTADAEVARRTIDINANNTIGAEAAQALVPIDDPVLAQLEGTFKGLGIGSDFVSALDQLPPDITTNTSWVRTGLGWQAVRTTRSDPQEFDIRDQFPDLDQFLRGG